MEENRECTSRSPGWFQMIWQKCHGNSMGEKLSFQQMVEQLDIFMGGKIEPQILPHSIYKINSKKI